jgi:hypothetical protein
MRRNYISPEFEYNKVYGTFNMVEGSSYFGSKMLKIEDEINIDNKSIIWYQKSNNEQMDLQTESKLNPTTLDINIIKSQNHNLSIDKSQSEFQKSDKTKWILKISLREIFINYLYGKMKEYRTFEGVANNMTIYNDVDVAIKNYILSNVIGRYKFNTIDLFLEYRELKNQNVLKLINNFSADAETNGNKLNKIDVSIDYNQTLLEVRFAQEKSSSQFAFNYYFNLKFKKI